MITHAAGAGMHNLGDQLLQTVLAAGNEADASLLRGQDLGQRPSDAAGRPVMITHLSRQNVGESLTTHLPDEAKRQPKGSDVQNSIFAAHRPAMWMRTTPRKLDYV